MGIQSGVCACRRCRGARIASKRGDELTRNVSLRRQPPAISVISSGSCWYELTRDSECRVDQTFGLIKHLPVRLPQNFQQVEWSFQAELIRDETQDQALAEAKSNSNEDLVEEALVDESRPALSSWSRNARLAASFAIVGYLAIVLLGPLANPNGSADLAQPLARAVAPVHQAAFLGHGYRFFAPEPGPSHLVRYRITPKTGEKIEGHFPDRDEHWPRLMYHRWFMLSETIYEEHALTPDRESFEAGQGELKSQVKALRTAGQLELADRVEADRQRQAKVYEDSRKRIDQLVQAVAAEILRRNPSDGERVIELFIQERSIPFPSDVVMGMKLEDTRFLSEPVSIYPKLDLPRLDDLPPPARNSQSLLPSGVGGAGE